MRPLLTASALCTAIIGMSAADAAACSCVQIDDRSKLRQADAAFVGKLVGVSPLGSTGQSLGGPARFRYQITTRYKGLRGQRFVTVESTTDGGTCGLPTTRGRRYALYLDRRKGRWSSGLCHLTTAARMKAAAKARGGATVAVAPCAGA